MSNQRSIAVCAVMLAIGVGQVSGATYQYLIGGTITSNTIADLDFPAGSHFEMRFSYSDEACDGFRGCEAPFGSMIGAGDEIFTYVGEGFFSIENVGGQAASTYYGVIVEDLPSFLEFNDESIVGMLNEFDFGWHSDSAPQDVRDGYVPDGEEVGGFIALYWESGAFRSELLGTIDSVVIVPEPSAFVCICSGFFALIFGRRR